MSITLKLYGELRKLAGKQDDMTGSIGVTEVESADAGRVSDLLEIVGLQESEVSHIFVNRKYSSVRKSVRDGDRVALFPTDMGLLYHWYFTEEE